MSEVPFNPATGTVLRGKTALVWSGRSGIGAAGIGSGLGAATGECHDDSSVRVWHAEPRVALSFQYTAFMMQHDAEIVNLAHAYRVLDVAWDASPRAIKESYCRLVKRWHPDRQPNDTENHADSTLMTRLLNEAYARIPDAPLRKGFAAPFSAGRAPRSRTGGEASGDPSGGTREEDIPRDSPLNAAEYYRIMENARRAGARDDAARPFDWGGFAVRFVLGALFGALVSFRVVIDLWSGPGLVPEGIAVTILFCAFASGFGGEAFWRAIRPGGIGWWRRLD